MNGQEQKERQTAIAKLERQVEKMAQDFHDLWSAELDTRQKEDEQNREMFASMLDGETQFRKGAIQQALHVAKELALASSMPATQFITLVWWKRWGWCIFGYIFLIWTADADTKKAYYSKMAAEKARAQHVEKIAADMIPSPENLKKQQAFSERPQ